jgi:hypothetical protein
MNPHYPSVSRRAPHRCEYCHAPEATFIFPFEVEHVIPIARQGPDDESNLALACRACNLKKADHLTGWDEITQSEVRLFQPRLDRWEAHFQVEQETGAIQGTTPVGRATIERLEMNRSSQLEARRLWMQLGLFP